MQGGKKHGLMELRFGDDGSVHDVSPDLLKKQHAAAEAAKNRPPADRLPPIGLESLADDGSEPTQMMHSVHVDKEKSVMLDPEQARALIQQAEAKRAKDAALDTKVFRQSQQENTVMMQAPVDKTMMMDANYVRNHQGAAFGRGGDTAMIDLNKLNKAAGKKPPQKPSLGARIKGWFTSAS